MARVLTITNGSTINLLSDFRLIENGYRPRLMDGETVIEERYTLLMPEKADANTVISSLNSLITVLRKSKNYHDKDKPAEKVPGYIARKADGATNTEYALIRNFALPGYENPVDWIFDKLIMFGLELSLFYDSWDEVPPGTGTAVSMWVDPFSTTPPDYGAFLLSYDVTPFALWKFNETSGTTADNAEGTAALDGTYDGDVILDDIPFLTADPSAFVPIAAGYIDIYSAALNTAFDPNAGFLFFWLRTSGVIWEDSQEHWLLRIATSTSEFTIRKTANDYELEFARTTPAGSSTITVTIEGVFDEWHCYGMSWEHPGVHTAWLDGSILGTATTYYGWAGSLASGNCVFGNYDTAETEIAASSAYAYGAIYDSLPTKEQIETIMRFPLDQSPETAATVYTTNHHTYAKVHHVMYYDASLTTYSGNLLDSSPPYALLPTPAVGDMIYFSSRNDIGEDYGIFNNLVFDLDAGSGLTGVWEYADSATPTWDDLEDVTHPLIDHTSGLQVEGVNAVHFEPHDDWAVATVNSVPGYHVRFRITGVASPVAPQQQNRDIYTVTWPCVRLPAAQLPGTLPTRVQIKAYGDDDNNGASRIVMGARSTSRGDRFTAFLPASSTQNPYGVSYGLLGATGGTWEYEDSNISPTGVRTKFTPTSATVTAAQGPRWRIGSAVAHHYIGSFYVIARATFASPPPTDYRLRVGALVGDETWGEPAYTKWVDPANGYGGGFDVFFGTLDMSDFSLESQVEGIKIFLQVSHTSSSDIMYLYDLVLIPNDELFVDSQTNNTSAVLGYVNSPPSYLDINGLIPDQSAVMRSQFTDLRLANWLTVGDNEPTLNNGEEQIIWMLAAGSAANPANSFRVKINRNGRYAAMRGSS